MKETLKTIGSFAIGIAVMVGIPRVVGRRADIVRRTDRLYRAPGLRLSQHMQR